MADHRPNWNAGMAVIDARRDEKTEAKLAQVRTAIQAMLNDPDVPTSHLNANRIARRDDTPSSWFISEHSGQKAAENGYEHDLTQEIDQAKELKQKRLHAAAADHGTVSASKSRGYLSQIKTLMAQVNDAKAKLAAERQERSHTQQQLALALGAQREGGSLIDPAAHQEALNDITRLNGQVTALAATITEVKKGRTEALEQFKALEASNEQLGDALRDCTCQGNIFHLTGTKVRR